MMAAGAPPDGPADPRHEDTRAGAAITGREAVFVPLVIR
jgi:hypothetical protein